MPKNAYHKKRKLSSAVIGREYKKQAIENWKTHTEQDLRDIACIQKATAARISEKEKAVHDTYAIKIQSVKRGGPAIKIQALARRFLVRMRMWNVRSTNPEFASTMKLVVCKWLLGEPIKIPKWNIEEDTLEDGTIVRRSGPGHMGSPVMEFNPHPLKGIVPDPTEWHQEIVTNTLPFKTWVRPGKHASDHINIWDNGTITMSLTSNCFIG